MASVDDIRIEPGDARAKVEAGQALVLDVVQPGAWAGMPRAIHGALRIPPEELAARAGELQGARGVVAYCT